MAVRPGWPWHGPGVATASAADAGGIGKDAGAAYGRVHGRHAVASFLKRVL